jgi:tetratricopeptide (TPR) repeat protein
MLVGGFLLIKNTSFVKESPVLSRFASISWSENKSQARGYVWPMALEGVKERPLLGWGQEGFIYVFAKHYNPKMWGHEAWFDRVHNGFLEWLVAGGILGFLAFLSLYGSVIYMLLRSAIPPVEKGILCGLLSAYAFQSLFVFDNLVGYVLFFTLLGIVQNEYVRAHHKGEKAETNGVISGSAIAVTFGITLVFIYAVNATPLMQNITLLKAMQPQVNGPSENIKLFKKALAYDHMGNLEVTEHMSQVASSIIENQNVPMQIKQEFVTEVIKSFDKIVKANPLDAKTLIFAGSFLSGIGITDQGSTYLSKAEALAPKKQLIYIQQSVALMRQAKWIEAFEKAKIAYELEKSFPEAKVFYIVSGLYAKQNALVLDVIYSLAEEDTLLDGRVVKAMTDNGLGREVKEILSKRIETHPKESNAYTYLASVYQFEKNIPKAKEIIRKMIEVNPETKAEGEAMLQGLDQVR